MAYHHIREWRAWLKYTGFHPNNVPQAGVLWATNLSHIEYTKSHNTIKRTVTMRWQAHSKPSCHYSQNTQNATASAQMSPTRVSRLHIACNRTAAQQTADPCAHDCNISTKHTARTQHHNTHMQHFPWPATDHARANLLEKNTYLNP
jgi:hypothetical protein